MISESRARAIDYYFSYDFRARRKCFLITSVVGFLALVTCRVASLPEPTALLASSVAILVTFALYLARYRSREGVSLQGGFKQQTLAKLWESNKIFPGRRRALFEVPAFAAALLCLAFIPNPSEAQVVNDRIRWLRRSRRIQEARAFAQSAAAANIALAPDVVSVLGTPTVLADGESFDAWLRAPAPYRGPRLVPVRLETGEVITILEPVIYIPKGDAFIIGGLQLYRASVAGDGPNETVLVTDSCGVNGTPALFSFPQRVPPGTAFLLTEDVLIYGMTVRHRGAGRECGGSLLSVERGPFRVAVSNLILESLYQSLDRIIWDDVQFRSCTISCGGDWFRMTNVRFLDCRFDFVEGFPASIRTRLESGSGRPISMSFNP
jgi:hypothetical protein